MQRFIDVKEERKKSGSIEAVLYPIIINCISIHGNQIPIGILWDSIKQEIEGKGDEEANLYYTSDYGAIYRNTITNIICDKFGALKKHKGKGNVLIFNLEKVNRMGISYSKNSTIHTKKLNVLEDEAEGCEGSESSRESLPNWKNSRSTEMGKM